MNLQKEFEIRRNKRKKKIIKDERWIQSVYDVSHNRPTKKKYYDSQFCANIVSVFKLLYPGLRRDTTWTFITILYKRRLLIREMINTLNNDSFISPSVFFLFCFNFLVNNKKKLYRAVSWLLFHAIGEIDADFIYEPNKVSKLIYSCRNMDGGNDLLQKLNIENKTARSYVRCSEMQKLQNI